jgi:hypothetical protein
MIRRPKTLAKKQRKRGGIEARYPKTISKKKKRKKHKSPIMTKPLISTQKYQSNYKKIKRKKNK